MLLLLLKACFEIDPIDACGALFLSKKLAVVFADFQPAENVVLVKKWSDEVSVAFSSSSWMMIMIPRQMDLVAFPGSDRAFSMRTVT